MRELNDVNNRNLRPVAISSSSIYIYIYALVNSLRPHSIPFVYVDLRDQTNRTELHRRSIEVYYTLVQSIRFYTVGEYMALAKLSHKHAL